MTRYRVTAENVTVPTAWEAGRPAADRRVIRFQRGDRIPEDVARRARQAKLAIAELPAPALAALVLNGFVEEVASGQIREQ